MDQVKDSVHQAGREAGIKLDPFAASRFWFFKSLKLITLHKLDFLQLTLKKIYLFWNHYEFAHNADFYFCRTIVAFLKLPFLPFGLIAPLGILGMALALRNRIIRSYPVIITAAVYMLSVVIFFISDRFRLPIVPFLIIFAAFLLDYTILAEIANSCLYIDLIRP